MRTNNLTMKRVLKSFFLIINYKTLIVTALAVISTYICYHYGLTAKFPDMLVGVAIVFPVVFSIGSAYNPPETALQRFSEFKGHAIAMYYATRDWTTVKDNTVPARLRAKVNEMTIVMRNMFRSTHRPDWQQNERKIYGYFSELSLLVGELRHLGVQSGEVSRVNQYVS